MANGHVKYGMYIEVKDYWWNLECTNVNVVDATLEELKKNGLGMIDDCKDEIPVILHSFELDAAVKVLASDTDLPHLYCTNEREPPEPLQRWLVMLGTTLIIQSGVIIWLLPRMFCCRKSIFNQGESPLNFTYK